ncbi:MAG: helix-turn-helix domain-containing protein [Christensenellaceae bacterium]|jgi:transcriptional regulator with XRE-family HTH domain|nr:helix-turn-helix domain-containing protein [Christensenellaceae bacterium]
MDIFTERLRAALKNNGTSTAELARRLLMPYTTVASWTSGKSRPDYETLIKVSKILDETVDYLIGNDN